MPFTDEAEAVKQAISGFGVDEDSLLEIFSNLKLKDIRRFRTSTPETIKVDNVCRYKTIADYDSESMKTCFLHFPKALGMWTKHPYERDACLMRSAFEGEEGVLLSKKIVAEVICTRTSAEVVGAKMAYQQMYETTLEQQLDTCTPQTRDLKLLSVILAEKSTSLNELEDLQKNVRVLFQTLRRGGENRAVDLITDETVYYINMLLGEQSKLLNDYSYTEDVDDYEIIRVILKCRRDPVSYFRDVIDDALEANDADALTRVIVTRADIDMDEIKKAFFAKHNISLTQKIKDVAKGYYKYFILSLMARSADD